jgi:uncharacterized LabA/DUF88 family protein
MTTPGNNAAFIDSQNLHLGTLAIGWKLHWRKFRIFLAEKYGVEKAFLFVGFIPENQQLYTSLQESGYILVFKPVLPPKSGKHKGNVDADLVLRAMTEYPNYERAVVVTSDGDFYSLVDYLYQTKKLETVLSPSPGTCSALLKKAARERIQFLDVQRHKLEYIKAAK